MLKEASWEGTGSPQPVAGSLTHTRYPEDGRQGPGPAHAQASRPRTLPLQRPSSLLPDFGGERARHGGDGMPTGMVTQPAGQCPSEGCLAEWGALQHRNRPSLPIFTVSKARERPRGRLGRSQGATGAHWVCTEPGPGPELRALGRRNPVSSLGGS